MNKQQKIKELKEELARLENETVIQKIPAKTIEWVATSPTEMTWDEAKEWCKEQGAEMPTRIELLQACEDKVDGFVADNYWSATESSSTYAYNVSFSNCATFYNYKTFALYVRCIRRK